MANRTEPDPSLIRIAALSLFLATVEYLIPKPFPFMRIGIANMPVLLFLDFLSPYRLFCLAVLKILGQGIIHGTLFSYVILFSAAGSFASILVMKTVRSLFGKERISLFGVSLFGSLGSCAAQLAVALTLIFPGEAGMLALPMIATSAAGGAVVGIFSRRFADRSRWVAAVRAELAAGSDICGTAPVLRKPERIRPVQLRFWLAFPLIAALFAFDAPECRILLAATLAASSRAVGFTLRFKPVLIFSAAVLFFHLLSPYGAVIATVPLPGIGEFPVTAGALENGMRRILLFLNLVFVSGYAVSERTVIPGRIGETVQALLLFYRGMAGMRGVLSARRPVASLDAMLTEIEDSGLSGSDNSNTEQKERKSEYFWLFPPVAAAIFCLLWELF